MMLTRASALPWNEADAVLQGHHVVALAQAVAELRDVTGRLGVEDGLERGDQGQEYRKMPNAKCTKER